jgi:putative membrane protein
MSKTSMAVLFTVAAITSVGCSSKDETTPESSYSESSGSESTAIAEAEPIEEAPSETSEPVGAGVDPVSPARSPGDMAKAADLSDQQITHITDTVDSGEIEQAKLAQSKAKNASVKKFAKQMATHHGKSKKEGEKLAKKSALEPQESPVCEDLKRKSDETLETLKTTEKADFDQKYMDAQVTQHEEVLNLIDRQLMPSVESPELKSQLEKTRTMVDSHLSEAKQIQTELSSKAEAASAKASAE